MNNELRSRDDDHDALIEALLRAAYVDEGSTTSERVDQVMRRIGGEVKVPVRTTRRGDSVNRRSWSRWVSWSIAVSVLLAIFAGFPYFGSTRQALAAIEQSLAAAAEEVARKYLITVTFRRENRTSEVSNDLYVQGNDRFALRHPAFISRGDLWLGKNGDQTWVVPAFGPVRTGNDLALNRWLSSQEQVSTPYLHVTTVLDRMSRGYRLREMGEARIRLNAGNEVRCRHVCGELKTGSNQRLPATIQLWSDATTGVAMRLEAEWNLPAAQSGRKKVIIEFVEQLELPENWFEAEGHYTGSRRKITLDTRENE